MATVQEWLGEEAGAIEDRFLAALGEIDARADELVSVVEALRAEGRRAVADNFANLLDSALDGSEDKAPAARLWAVRCAWHMDEAKYRAEARRRLEHIFRRDPNGLRMVRAVGWDSPQPLRECVRRYLLLRGLRPGMLVRHKTWGFGTVTGVDAYNEKVGIDFEDKPGHALSFAFAAETLELIDETHILARLHRDPEGIRRLVAEAPAEIVKLAIASFGPLPVVRLQDLLCAKLLPAGEWKSFWDAARKVLKNDPLVDIPAKRTAPIRILERAKAYDSDWGVALRQNTDLQGILRAITEALAASASGRLDDAAVSQAADRLNFVIGGAAAREDLRVRAILLAGTAGIPTELVDRDAALAPYFDPETLVRAATAIGARDHRALIGELQRIDPERTRALLLGILPELPLGSFNETVDHLEQHGAREALAEVFRKAIGGRTATPELLLWIGKRLERVTEWNLGRLADLPGLCLDALLRPAAGERLRARNQVPQLLEDREWLARVLDPMSSQERRDFLARVQLTAAPHLDRQILAARIINLFPDAHVEPEVVAATEQPPPAQGVTSWRRHRERQAELRRLVEVDIPQNSREIAVARGYGDLRENHEYKSAKEMQGILMQRQTQLDADLRRVQGTDFSGFPHDRVGIGTEVEVQFEDGSTFVVRILGEWDREESLHIVSSGSQLAQALSGTMAGDRVVVPSGQDSTRPGTVVRVGPIPDAVREWATDAAVAQP